MNEKELSGTVTVDQNQGERVLGSGLLWTKRQEQYDRINLSSSYEEEEETEERRRLEAVSSLGLSPRSIIYKLAADEKEGTTCESLSVASGWY